MSKHPIDALKYITKEYIWLRKYRKDELIRILTKYKIEREIGSCYISTGAVRKGKEEELMMLKEARDIIIARTTR